MSGGAKRLHPLFDEAGVFDVARPHPQDPDAVFLRQLRWQTAALLPLAHQIHAVPGGKAFENVDMHRAAAQVVEGPQG